MTTSDFNMKTDYWRLEVESANAEEVKIKITIAKEPIPEAEYRNLESHIRLILQGCARLAENPSKR